MTAKEKGKEKVGGLAPTGSSILNTRFSTSFRVCVCVCISMQKANSRDWLRVLKGKYVWK